MKMTKRWLLLTALAAFVAGGFLCGEVAAAKEQVPLVGAVTLNGHPKSLDGKTVVLRWNSKFNGDKFLDRLAELLTQNAPKVKIVKMYKVDPSTVTVSKDLAESVAIAARIAAQKPDLVIASQAD